MNTPTDPLHPAVRDARLTDRLDELKTALAGVEAPARLEATHVDRIRDHGDRRRRAARPRLWWMPPLAMVATLAVVGWMVRNPALQPAAQPDPEFTAAADDAGPFLALKPLERIALEPQATVVTTEFPRAYLAQWGLPVAPERAGEPVRAELLYSSDGEALAVRLLDSN